MNKAEFYNRLNEEDRKNLEADLIKKGYSESGARMLSKTATYASDEECEHHANNQRAEQPNPCPLDAPQDIKDELKLFKEFHDPKGCHRIVPKEDVS